MHPLLALPEIQDTFRVAQDKDEFAEPIRSYHRELYSQIKRLVDQIKQVFISGQGEKGYKLSDVIDAMRNKPIYLCGGGSVYKKMRGFGVNELLFADKKTINKYQLNIEHLSNAGNIPDELYPIVATAYGLSKPVDVDEELDEKPLDVFFNHLPTKPVNKPQEKTPENDYSLARGTW